MTRRKRLRFQNRVLVLVLLAVVPGWAGTVVLLYLSSATPALRWTIIGFLTFFVLIGLVAVRRHVVRPLQTLANMLEALREGDYSMRGRNVDPEDAFGEVMVEVNTLSRTLYDQRLEALEAGALLQKIIADVDIAVFAFDAALRLRIVNKAGEALLGGTIETIAGPQRRRARPPRDARRAVGPHHGARVSGRRRPVGDSPPQLPRGRQAARAARDLRAVARVARGRAPSVAAHRPRHRPRAEQLACADQVDGRHSAQARRP